MVLHEIDRATPHRVTANAIQSLQTGVKRQPVAFFALPALHQISDNAIRSFGNLILQV